MRRGRPRTVVKTKIGQGPLIYTLLFHNGTVYHGVHSISAGGFRTKVAAKFKPDWKLPAGCFSAWHYMVLERTPDTAFHYDRPLIILLDTGCFSATDIFLGGFSGHRNVTLMGTRSGGGSGRSRSEALPNSGLTVRMSTMASFRPNGQRYDGKGIAPDTGPRP